MRRCFVMLAAIAGIVGVLDAQQLQPPAVGAVAPDFPPGFFTDGNTYRLADLKGKVVVLDFFETNSEKSRKAIPLHDALAKAMAGQPVRFISIAVWAYPQNAIDLQKTYKFSMPVFADSSGLMAQRYGLNLGPFSDWSTVVIDPEGKVAGSEMTKADLEKLAETTKAANLFTSPGIVGRFASAAELFEAGQFAAGNKQFAEARRFAKKDDESLRALQASLKKAAAGWLAEADAVQSTDPVRAHELCQRIVSLLPGDDLAKSVQKPLQLLSNDKTVKADLLARPAFANVTQSMLQGKTPPKTALAPAFADVAKRYPNTPTGMRAKTLATELGYKWPTKK